MGNNTQTIKNKEGPSRIIADEKKSPTVVKKMNTHTEIKAQTPPVISQPLIQHRDESFYVNEAIYMKEDLFRIERDKLKELLHRSMGALTFYSAHNQRGFGSGVLISPNAVLTAAHNIYERRLKQQNKRFRFYLGASGVAQSYHQIQGWRYPDQFKTCSPQARLKFDYAIMKLKKEVSFDQFLPIAPLCPTCLLQDNQKVLKIYGFPCAYPLGPSDLPGYPRSYKDNFQNVGEDDKKLKLFQYGLARQDRIRLIDIPGSKIGYEISTLPGQSGSPVTVDNRIIAIHAGDGERKQFNVGRIVDHKLLENIEKWGKQLITSLFKTEKDAACRHCSIVTFSFTDIKKISRTGSGVLISKNLVLTAAHNLFDRQLQAENENFKIYFGGDVFTIDSFRYPKQFKTCMASQETKHSYALVKLNGNVPFEQFMQIFLPCIDCLLENKQGKLQINGFPDVAFYNDYSIQYVTSIYKDQIGAPLVINNQTIGVHTTDEKKENQMNQLKVGRLIDSGLVENLQSWSKQLNGVRYKYAEHNCYHRFRPNPQNPFYKIKDSELKKIFHRSVCQVIYLPKNQSKLVRVSGVLLSKNIVLTTAQICIERYQGMETKFRVYFVEEDGISRNRYEVQSLRYSQERKSRLYEYRLKWDYALLKLKKSVQYNKFPKISLPCEKCIMKQNNSQYSQLFGFPLFQQNDVNWTFQDKEQTVPRLVQYGSASKNAVIDFSEQYMIKYNLISMSGMSGSPVMIKDRIVALHVGYRAINEKFGRLITPELIANIKQWCLQLEGEQFEITNENHICKYELS